MDEIKTNYIEKALSDLVPVIGTKEFVDHHKLISLLQSNQIKECIKEIALYLGLPININLSNVAKGYRPSANDGFHSTHLIKTDKSGKGSSGIIAQVSIPTNLPLYGTSNMVGFPISVRVSENCLEKPETFVAVMAHEISHIVLHSIFHEKKENEVYTDLTAMLLGFAKVMRVGRKIIKTSSSVEHDFWGSTTTTTTETTGFGYLSDENFDFAFNRIKNALNNQKKAKKKFLGQLIRLKKQLKQKSNLLIRFNKYLEYLDKNPNKKISQKDGHAISSFHQSGYTDIFQSVINKEKAKIESSLMFVKSLSNYTNRNMKIMQQYKVQLELGNKDLVKQYFLIKKDVYILGKYISWLHRLKLK